MLLKDKTVVHFGKFSNPPLLVSCWSRKYVIDFSDPDQKKTFSGSEKIIPDPDPQHCLSLSSSCGEIRTRNLQVVNN